MEHVFCFDGDRIGEALLECISRNDIDAANNLCASFNAAIEEICRTMRKLGATCIFRGGDSLIFKSKIQIDDQFLPTLVNEFSFSIGVAGTVRDAAASLFLAKAMGRARVERAR